MSVESYDLLAIFSAVAQERSFTRAAAMQTTLRRLIDKQH